MANKIKYGLSNVYYAKATIGSNNTATYGTPVAIPGAVSLSLDAQGEQTIFYADNIAYWTGGGNDGYQGGLEIALVPNSFKKDILGMYEDNKHVLVEDQDAPVVHFALLFQFEGDAKATRHVLYNCTVTRPSVAGATKEESVTPQTESMTITAKSIYNATLQKNIIKSSTTENVVTSEYTAWNSAVYSPSATAAST